MKSDQFTLFISPSYLTKWDSMEQPSVVVDYEYEDLEMYVVKYVSFEPEVLAKLKPLAQFDILSEVNQAVYQRVVDSFTDNYMDLLERVGVRRAEQ